MVVHLLSKKVKIQVLVLLILIQIDKKIEDLMVVDIFEEKIVLVVVVQELKFDLLIYLHYSIRKKN